MKATISHALLATMIASSLAFAEPIAARSPRFTDGGPKRENSDSRNNNGNRGNNDRGNKNRDNRNDRRHDRGNHYGHHYGHHKWHKPVPPPFRHHRPMGRPIPRPVCPVGYHPYHGAPVISTILGLTFGTLYNSALDYLSYKGYEIDGYMNNTIYLRNVRELAYTWPDATMYYDTMGRLNSAQFIYSTTYNALGRYDRIYRDLCRSYGPPVCSHHRGHKREMMWYGGDSRGYVSLEYDFTNGRFFTILSYGR